MANDVEAAAARRVLTARVAAFTTEQRQGAARQEAKHLEAERQAADCREAERLANLQCEEDARVLVIANQNAAATATLHA